MSDEDVSSKMVLVDQDVPSILGIKVVLSQEHYIQNEDIFDGLGCFKIFIYDADLIENPTFEIRPPRKILYSIRDKMKIESVLTMVKLGVIKPTPAVSPLVIVQQKEEIRISIDST